MLEFLSGLSLWTYAILSGLLVIGIMLGTVMVLLGIFLFGIPFEGSFLLLFAALATLNQTFVRETEGHTLVLLRLPALCTQLAQLCDQHDRQGQRRRQQLSQAWLRRRRGRQP